MSHRAGSFAEGTVRIDSISLVSMRALRDAYAASHYRVLLDTGHANIRIGQPLPAEVQALLERHGATRAAFLSACNPRSTVLSPDENAQRHRALLAALASHGVASVPGTGHDPHEIWPPEDSVLAIGLPHVKARALAERFAQFAWVDVASGAPARLVFTSLWQGERGV